METASEEEGSAGAAPRPYERFDAEAGYVSVRDGRAHYLSIPDRHLLIALVAPGEGAYLIRAHKRQLQQPDVLPMLLERAARELEQRGIFTANVFLFCRASRGKGRHSAQGLAEAIASDWKRTWSDLRLRANKPVRLDTVIDAVSGSVSLSPRQESFVVSFAEDVVYEFEAQASFERSKAARLAAHRNAENGREDTRADEGPTGDQP